VKIRKYDDEMTKPRQYDGENSLETTNMVKCRKCNRENTKLYRVLAIVIWLSRLLTIVLSTFHHRLFSIFHHRGFVISTFHHRTFDFSLPFLLFFIFVVSLYQLSTVAQM
jgi:hypothetical protein